MDITELSIFFWLQFHTFHSTVLFYDFLSSVDLYGLCPLRQGCRIRVEVGHAWVDYVTTSGSVII